MTPASGGLEVVEVGEGEREVVFVHGVLDRGRSFERVAHVLAAECRMRWYDRRGYGSALDATGVPLGVDGHAADLVEVLGNRPAVVVGHSFGGVSVLLAALRAPELVRAVVLYETGMAWLPGWDDRVLSRLLGGEDPEGAGVRLMFGERYDQMDPDERRRRRREARAFVAEERSVRTGTPPLDVADLERPLVFGHGGQPPFLSVADHLRTVVRDVEVMVIPGAGHNAHRTRPAAFADLVRKGIARADARAGGESGAPSRDPDAQAGGAGSSGKR